MIPVKAKFCAECGAANVVTDVDEELAQDDAAPEDADQAPEEGAPEADAAAETEAEASDDTQA